MRLAWIWNVFTVVLILGNASARGEDGPKDTLAEARARWLKGNYAEARELYQQLGKEPKNAAAAAVGLARVEMSEGKTAKAMAALEAALRDAEDDTDLLAAKADLLYRGGKWDEALELAERVIKGKSAHFLARWVRAQIWRDQGEMKNADQEMRWFVRTYTQRSNMDADIKDPDELLIVGQAGTENARWHSLSDQFEFILNEIYTDVRKMEPDCWMAEWLAGSMLLEKVNLPEAVKAFDKALQINPRAAEAFVGKGQASLSVFEMKDAELFAEQALKINPRLPAALRLRADIDLMSGQTAKARTALEKAAAVNGREEPTLARLALLDYLAKRSEEFDKRVALVQQNNPKPGVFYHQLAQGLEEHKLFLAAEKYLEKALECNDKLAAPKNSLGLLYLRLGKENEARAQLDKAFQFDPFNVRVANSRKVLKHLAGYQTKESDHYLVRYDQKTDAILADFVIEYLEEMHARLSRDFNYAPTEKTLVEIFNTHEMFSGRTVALPDLHTIGACTGRVITMVSPHGKGLAKPFNWGRVIRHELVHIFNLGQTDFQVPHWLTEGLAVRNEGPTHPPAWDAILRERFDKNDLFNLDTILLGFVRPRTPEEWTLAYCQSLLYVQYLIKSHGIEAVGKMLDAYRTGASDATAIEQVCGVSKADFEKGYRSFLKSTVAGISTAAAPKEKAMTLKELEEAHRKDPADADVAGRLAAEYWRRKKTREAGALADEVLAKAKGHPAATIVKARLRLAEGADVAARDLVEAAVAQHGQDTRLLGYLAKLLLDAKEFTAAADCLEKCRRLDPVSNEWLLQLEELYKKTQNKPKLAAILREVAERDADDLPTRKQLARLLLDEKKSAAAEEAAREAIQIDVLDVEAQKLLLEALRNQDKAAEADKLAQRFGKQ